MKSDEYVKLDALETARLIAKGEVSAWETLDCALDRASLKKERVNAISYLNADMGKLKAQKSGQGPFQGVPFLVKDLLSYPGLRSAMGSHLFAKHVPSAESPDKDFELVKNFVVSTKPVERPVEEVEATA